MSKRGRGDDEDKHFKKNRDYPEAQAEWLASLENADADADADELSEPESPILLPRRPMALGALPAPLEPVPTDPFWDMSEPYVVPAHELPPALEPAIPIAADDDDAETVIEARLEDLEDYAAHLPPIPPSLDPMPDGAFARILSYLSMRDAGPISSVSKRFAVANRTHPVRNQADHRYYNEASRGRRVDALRNDPQTILDLSKPYSDNGFVPDIPFLTPFEDIAAVPGKVNCEAVKHLLDLADLDEKYKYEPALAKLHESGCTGEIDRLAQIEILNAEMLPADELRAVCYLNEMPARFVPYQPFHTAEGQVRDNILKAMAFTNNETLLRSLLNLKFDSQVALDIAFNAYCAYLKRMESNPELLTLIRNKTFCHAVDDIVAPSGYDFSSLPNLIRTIKELRAVGARVNSVMLWDALEGLDLDGLSNQNLAELIMEAITPLNIQSLLDVSDALDVAVAFELAKRMPFDDYEGMAEAIESRDRYLATLLRRHVNPSYEPPAMQAFYDEEDDEEEEDDSDEEEEEEEDDSDEEEEDEDDAM